MLRTSAVALVARAPLEPEGDVALHRQVREERVVLEDHPDPPPLRRHERRRARQLGPADGDRAGVGALEAGDQPQQRGLAAAGRPQHRDQLAARDLEVDAGDRAHAAEGLDDASDRDVAHATMLRSAATGDASAADQAPRDWASSSEERRADSRIITATGSSPTSTISSAGSAAVL